MEFGTRKLFSRTCTAVGVMSILLLTTGAWAQKLTKLEIVDEKVGTGAAVAQGDLVIMTYTGRLRDGKIVDSNAGLAKNPFAFVLGFGEVIKGWDEGIKGMRVGGKRKLSIPASLAYGAQQNGVVPANSDLFFEVELLDVVKKGEEWVYDKKDLKVGTGPKVKKGDTLTVKYVGKLPNGKVFDSSEKQGKPLTFVIGEGNVIRGWDYALIGMQAGGKRWLRLPPNCAYGAMGRGKDLPGNMVLLFEVELLKLQPGK